MRSKLSISSYYFLTALLVGSTLTSGCNQNAELNMAGNPRKRSRHTGWQDSHNKRSRESLSGPFHSSQGPGRLIEAAEQGQINAVRSLLDDGAWIEQTDCMGKTALICAARAGQTEVVKLLLDRGARIDARDMHGKTPLMLAADKGQVTVVNLLLRRGASRHLEDQGGRTALMWATWSRQEEVVRILNSSYSSNSRVDIHGNPTSMLAKITDQVGQEIVVNKKKHANRKNKRKWRKKAQKHSL